MNGGKQNHTFKWTVEVDITFTELQSSIKTSAQFILVDNSQVDNYYLHECSVLND